VLSEGAEFEPDELDPDGLEPEESSPKPPSSKPPSSDGVDGLAAVPPFDEVDGTEAEPAPELPAWVPVACLAASAGSWPLTSVPKITAHVPRKSATVRATIVRRMLLTRARRAVRRGWGAAADMARSLPAQSKALLSTV
jgi:hypothetical protein